MYMYDEVIFGGIKHFHENLQPSQPNKPNSRNHASFDVY